MILHVDVVNKIATFQKRDGSIVCGNSDYQIQFTFDSEWNDYPAKTARFISNGQYTDVNFTGDFCAVPTLYDTTKVEVGVYAGELKTTTSAIIGCHRSILCEAATPSTENDRSHANEAKEAAARAEAAAAEATERVEEAVQFATDKVEAATNDAAERAEAAAKVAEEAAERAELEGGGISAEVDRRLKAIEEQLSYEPIKFNSLTMEPSATRYEHGNSIPSVKLKWELSKEAASITVNGTAIDPTATEYELTGPFTTDQSWTVTVKDAKGGQASGTKSIDFYHLVYWGVTKQADGFDADFIAALQPNAETDTKSRTFYVTPNEEYIYYVVPENLCGTEPTFKMDDGFSGGFNTKVSFIVTKTFGERTVNIVYNVYRSIELIKDPDGEPTKVAVS